jgi:hypothetical protein
MENKGMTIKVFPADDHRSLFGLVGRTVDRKMTAGAGNDFDPCQQETNEVQIFTAYLTNGSSSLQKGRIV